MKKIIFFGVALFMMGLGLNIQAENDCRANARTKLDTEQRRCSTLGNSRAVRNCRRRATLTYNREIKNCPAGSAAVQQESPIEKCKVDSKQRYMSRVEKCKKYSGRRASNCRRREAMAYNNELSLWCSKIKVPRNECEIRALNSYNRRQNTCNNYQRGQDSCRRGATTQYERDLRRCPR